jgi:hypothetical protein
MLESVEVAEFSGYLGSNFFHLGKEGIAWQAVVGADFKFGRPGPIPCNCHSLQHIISTHGLIYVPPYAKDLDVENTSRFGWSTIFSATSCTVPVSCSCRRRWEL